MRAQDEIYIAPAHIAASALRTVQTEANSGKLRTMKKFIISMVLATMGWAAAYAAVAQPASTGSGQAYPTRALRLVVPFAPGGSTDTLARVVGQRLTESLGQSVVVDNRAAAGGIVGADLVAKAQPDGYTLLVGAISTMAIAPALYPKLPYDPRRDFVHAGLWVTFPLVLIVTHGSPITGLKGLVDQARAKPGALRFSAQGIGTSSHVFAEWMNSLAKIKVVIVPYKGGGPALTGVLAGEVDYSMVAVSTAIAQVNAGKIRALGVTSAQTTPYLPNVPSIASVLPGYDALNFHGVHLPAGTPPAIVARLNGESAKILQRADVAEKLNGFAMDIVTGTPDQYGAFIKAQIERWGPVVISSGMRAD
jgi:tripartite-type tricarboxylate transporter receptor subunit TctC